MKSPQTNYRRIILGFLLLMVLTFAIWTFPSIANRGLKAHWKMASISKITINAPAALPVISIDDVTVAEGDTGTVDAVFTVSLTPSYTATVSVDYTTQDGSAVEPGDYITTTGTADILTGTLTTEIAVPVQGDVLVEGDETFSIVLSNPTNAAIGDGTGLGTITGDDYGVVVSPLDLTTAENGITDTFSVVLMSKPGSNVDVLLSSTDTGEGTVSASKLVFTAGNWLIPQDVTVTGVNDDVVDGDISYAIQITTDTADPLYSPYNPQDVSVTNNDNDTAGIDVSPPSLTTSEGGATDTLTVTLTSQPTATVTIDLSSSDTGEGTVSPSSLVFSGADWSDPHTATITGVDDFVQDGDQNYTIVTAAAVSADPNYSGMNAADVPASNQDNDNGTAGIVLDPTTGLVTTEGAGTDQFTVALNSAPTGAVTVALTSLDPTEGLPSPGQVTFTSGDWYTPTTITVTGVNDDVDDGDVSYSIEAAVSASEDPQYVGVAPVTVGVTNNDNDTANIIVDPVAGLTTAESGIDNTDVFTVVLATEPTDVVTVTLSSSDETEGLPSPGQVAFTAGNWDTPQPVTVTGVDDFIVDGLQNYTIVTTATSDDPKYDGLLVPDVSVTNNDDSDAAGVIVDPTADLDTTEGGGTAQFNITLTSEPTAVVTITLSSSDDTEGIPSPTLITFDNQTWDDAQSITITGQNDFLIDGDVVYTIITSAADSSDPDYSGLIVADVSVTNSDDDAAGFTISPTTGLITDEGGSTDTFTVRLDSKPTDDVTLPLSSNDLSEGTVSPGSLVFTPDDWNSPQEVTVTGVDDDLADGDQPYTINTGAAVSSDGNFSGVNPADVSVTNQDDDTPGITIQPTTGLETTEAGGEATFTVVLDSQPTNLVDVYPIVEDTSEGRVVISLPLKFDDQNWDQEQTVRIRGVDDFVVDGGITYQVHFDVYSSDGNYNGLAPGSVSITNLDNDSTPDTENPTVLWNKPLDNGGQMVITATTGPIIWLEVNPSDDTGIQRVRFYRWDASVLANVDIGNIYDPPYRVPLDTRNLNYGWNQINAVAYDTAGNKSDLGGDVSFIWLIKYWSYMPMVNR